MAEATMQAYSPTWRDKMAMGLLGDARPGSARYNMVQGLLGSTGLGTSGMGLLDLTPMGIPMAAQDAQRSAQAGDALGAGLNAMAVIPAAKAPIRAAQQGIRAYHGSPHSFDKFDMSKIGTGEGAQAYGHGLYFAESEDVARGYRQALERRNVSASWDGKPVESWPGLVKDLQGQDWRAAKVVDEMGRVGGDPAKFFQGQRDWYRGQPEMLAAVEQVEKRMAAKHTPGSMYEVNIRANPDQFLDWDKPLKEQGSQIQQYMKDLQDLGGKVPDENLTGRDWYSSIANESMKKNGLGFGPEREKATEVMKWGGIPGIKYLDGGSRGAGEGSRNYVVFDDSLIDILRKYGIAGGLLGGGLGAAAMSGQPTPIQPPQM